MTSLQKLALLESRKKSNFVPGYKVHWNPGSGNKTKRWTLLDSIAVQAGRCETSM